MGFCLVLTTAFTFSVPFIQSAKAWDGADDSGQEVVIGKGNLVRSGRTITVEVDGENHDMMVDSIRSSGSGAQVEVTDDETGESSTLDMD